MFRFRSDTEDDLGVQIQGMICVQVQVGYRGDLCSVELRFRSEKVYFQLISITWLNILPSLLLVVVVQA